MWAAAHFQQLERVTVIGHQDFERGIVYGGVINLEGGQGFGVDENHRQCRDEVRLLSRGRRLGNVLNRKIDYQQEQTYQATVFKCICV